MKFILFLIACTLPCFALISESDLQKKRECFQKNGYLWIENFFSSEQMLLLSKWSEKAHLAAKNILAFNEKGGTFGGAIPGIPIIVAEDSNPLQACRAEDLLTCYPDFYHFIEGTVTTYLGELLGEPYVLFKDKLNFKWPNGGAFPPHQDFPAYQLFPPSKHVTAMICIDSATLENGCLQVAQNWRETFSGEANLDLDLLKEGRVVLPHVVGGSKHGSIQEAYCKKISWFPLTVSPGDLVLISSFIPHYSEVNRSETPRRAMFITFNKLKEGNYRKSYYHAKREDPANPIFHFATPTKARGK